MDLTDMPAPVREIIRAAYGDATAEIFLIAGVISMVAFIAIMFIKEKPLRRTVDIRPEPDEPHAAEVGPHTKADDGGTPPYGGTADGVDDLDREFVEVLSRQRASEARVPSARPTSSAPLARSSREWQSS